MENLKSKAIVGTIWSAVQRFGLMAISFSANIILARLLTPADYGCIAMLAIFIVIADTFMNSGLGIALIQKKDLTKEDSSTVFFFNFGVSIILYAILFFSAGYIASFYNLPKLKPILQVEGLVLIINSFAVVQTSLIRRRLEFKILAKTDIISSVLSVICSIGAGLMKMGVWALVIQQLSYSLFHSIMLWYMTGWRPKLAFSRKSFKELFNFGSFIFLSNMINEIANKIQAVFIGKMFNASTLGYFSQASTLENVASRSVSGIIDQVSYPALAAKQTDPAGMISVLRRMTNAIAFVTMPIMMLLSLIGHQVIFLCYGERWLGSVPYFEILCIAGIAVSLQGINYYAVAAIGKSKAVFYSAIVKRTITILLLFLGFIWGMKGFLIAVVVGSYFILFINALLVQFYIGFSIWQQIKDLLPTIVLTAVAFLTAKIADRLIPGNIFIVGAAVAIIFSGIYLVGAYLFRFPAIDSVKEVIYTILKNKKQK